MLRYVVVAVVVVVDGGRQTDISFLMPSQPWRLYDGGGGVVGGVDVGDGGGDGAVCVTCIVFK